MSKLPAAVRRFVSDESGASMTEYALLLAAVALAAVAALRYLGTEVRNDMNNVANQLHQL